MTASSLFALSWSLALALVLPGRADDSRPASPPGASLSAFASEVQAVTDTILTHHLDPPTRQQMILGGLKAAFQEAGVAPPRDLARKVSAAATPEQLASFLAEVWPSSDKVSSRQRLQDEFLEGVFAQLPGGGSLLSPRERKVADQVAGNVYVGIQVALGTDGPSKRPTIMEVLEGGPAAQAGLKRGDVIEEVEGVSTEGWSLRETVERLRGDEGTAVTVKIRDPKVKEARTLSMTRGRLPRKTVVGLAQGDGAKSEPLLGGQGRIAYLRLNEISGSTPQELRRHARWLEDAGARGLILDLRHASQGHLHPTVLVADALLDGGVIGKVATADGPITYRAEPDALFRGWPLAVLVAPGSSGEAQWLAAALQDNHRAVIVGQPTQGARDVATVVSLPGSDRAISMTTGRLERGDGRSLAMTSSNPRADLPRTDPRPSKPSGVVPDKIVGTPKVATPAAGYVPVEASGAADLVIQAAVTALLKALEGSGS